MTRLRAEVTRARDGLGFTPQLAFVTPHGRTEPSDADLKVAPEIGDDMVAVVREGLSNAARHARAHAVEVRVEWSAGSIVVAVRDDGVGLPPQAERRSGLANLGERARRHGGSFRIGTPVSGEGQPVPQGTELLWQVPLGPSAD
jgi:signal transduction histidine kinase